MNMKNMSQRYDINRHRSRHWHKYTISKMCHSMIILICIKQHPSNIWSWIPKKDKQNWGWVEKSFAYKYTLYKMRHSMIMLTYIKQHPSNIWSWIPIKKISETEAELKKVLLIKKACNRFSIQYSSVNSVKKY